MDFDIIRTKVQQMQSTGVVGGKRVVQVLNEPQHLHIGDQYQIQKDKAIHQLKEAVREDVTRLIKHAYDAVASHRG